MKHSTSSLMQILVLLIFRVQLTHVEDGAQSPNIHYRWTISTPSVTEQVNLEQDKHQITTIRKMMYTVVSLVALVASASAFSVSRVSSRSSSNVVMMAEKSKSLPFMAQPVNIVGMAGDVGRNNYHDDRNL